jgi:hypothetical protein
LYSVTEFYKRTGIELGYPNSLTSNVDLWNTDGMLPSAREYYEERIGEKSKERKRLANEERLQQEELEKEFEEWEIVNMYRSRKTKQSNRLKEWLYQQGIYTGMIEHGRGCRCCTTFDESQKRQEQYEREYKEWLDQGNKWSKKPWKFYESLFVDLGEPAADAPAEDSKK